MSFEQHREAFIAHCRNRRLSMHTIRAYRQDLADFQRWLERRASAVEKLSKDDLVLWLSWHRSYT